MRRIIKAIKSLSDYLILLKKNPELLRPEQCSHCGAGGLWSHGSYDRKPDRNPGKGRSLNPTPVLRFYCHQCKRTCSTLPEILSPKRWYCWSVQQAVLMSVLLGKVLAHQVRSKVLVDTSLLGGFTGWLTTSLITPSISKHIRCGYSLGDIVIHKRFGWPALVSMIYRASCFFLTTQE